ncbi:MAG: Crp/Fnr family transcriptional regulator [Bdellovibrionales bacterium]|nr:Crp/Fnr family transcriptional regulator [Bdellovibrionales bacterium]
MSLESENCFSCVQCSSNFDHIFSSLPLKEQKNIDSHRQTKIFHKGDFLFQQGQDCHGVYCISSGKVKLVKEGEKGKQSLLRITGSKDILGIRGSLLQKPYSASAIALETTHVCCIPCDFFRNLAANHPKLSMNLACEMAISLTQAEDKISNLLNQNVKQRLGHLLISLSASFGYEEKMGHTIDLPVTRAEMASMIGTSPESVMRILSEFEQKGYSRINKKKITIVDQEKLLEEIEYFDH